MNKKKLRPVTEELVDKIINQDATTTSYGCGSGSGSGSGSGLESGWYPAEYGCGNSEGSGSGLGLVVTNQPYTGIKFSDNLMKNPALATQLTELLHSSQSLRNILSQFVNGNSKLTFDLAEDKDNIPMNTDGETYTISINSKYVGEDGFNKRFIGKEKDNGGYLHDGTVDGTFAASIGHESLHAKHFYWYKESLKNGKTAEEHANFLKERGFSDNFVRIFYEKNAEKGWQKRKWDDINNNEHKYLDKYDKEVLDKVRGEYKSRYDSH